MRQRAQQEPSRQRQQQEAQADEEDTKKAAGEVDVIVKIGEKDATSLMNCPGKTHHKECIQSLESRQLRNKICPTRRKPLKTKQLKAAVKESQEKWDATWAALQATIEVYEGASLNFNKKKEAEKALKEAETAFNVASNELDKARAKRPRHFRI